jgi:hypothetical protein
MKPTVYKVIILEEAKADIKEARSYYRRVLRTLSTRFFSDVKNTVVEIKSHPFSFGFRFPDFRTANLSVFPYQVHYIIDEANAVLIIFAVLHAYRDPDFILSRF